MPRLAKFQQFCEGEGVVPVYLVDWPIAQSPLAAEILRAPLAAGKAEIGVQLHPWVNPPFEEEVTPHNSYAGNLAPELEGAKFRNLRDAIERNFGVAPTIYRAGRYGIGPNTAGLLRKGGVAIDTSVRAKFDYSSQGGPNYRRHPLTPYWLDEDRQLLELPLTTVFWGMLRRQGDWLYPALWRVPSLRGVLARVNLLERIPLTPEGVSVDEAIRGIDIALDDQLPLLVFSFHSPSLRRGTRPTCAMRPTSTGSTTGGAACSPISSCAASRRPRWPGSCRRSNGEPPRLATVPAASYLAARACGVRGPVAQRLELAAHNG